MSKYLFIGGIKDGEYLDVYDDNTRYWKIAEYEGLNFNSSIDPSMFKFEVKEHVYVKQFINGKAGMIPIFVSDKVPDVMSTLLKGYRKRKYKPKSKIKFY